MKQYLFLATLLIASLHVKAQNFFPLGTGFNYAVRALYADTATNIIYAGGNFTTAGGINVWNIARWNGIAWDSMGSGAGQNVLAITKYKGEIYAGGAFQTIGGVPAKGIAKWNGIKWDSVPNAPTKYVGGLLVYNDTLYVTGWASNTNNLYESRIFKYDGSNWYTFPVLDSDTSFGAMGSAVFYKGELYVGGNFDGGTNLRDIARFDGTSWKTVGGGLSGFGTDVDVLEVYKGELYVGGYFKTSFGDPGNYLVKWNGSNWVQLPAEPSGIVAGLKVYNNKLYAAGNFLSAGGLPGTADVAVWDSTNWSGIGIFDNGGTCFTELNGDLYIGGGFWTVNGDTMNGITKYTGTNGINDVSSGSSTINIYPNPTSGVFNVQMSKLENAQMKIYNVYGECIYQHISTSAHLKIDLSEASDGIYFVRVQTEQGMVSKKVVVLR